MKSPGVQIEVNAHSNRKKDAASKTQLANQALRGLWKAVCLAKEMGSNLGGSSLLQPALS